MRRLLTIALLAAVAAAEGPEEEWVFSFGNGDRLRGKLAGIRNGSVFIATKASARAVTVALGEVASATPEERDEPAPEPLEQVLRLRDGGALLGRCRAILQGKLEFEVASIGRVTIPGRDVEELLPPEDAVRAYYRTVRPDAGTRNLPQERIASLWSYLGERDANLALQAHRELVRAGDDGVRALAARVRVQPDSPEVIAGWIAALDADTAEVRVLAHVRLRLLGTAAAQQLKAAADEPRSAEARQRIASLLAALEQEPETPREPDPDVVRFQRAIRVLEEIGSKEAQEVLERLANTAPEAPTSRAAQAALERLRRAR